MTALNAMPDSKMPSRQSCLMIEVAAELRKAGWMAGFLDPPYTDNVAWERWQALDQLIAYCDDLAETRPDAFLPDLALNLGAQGHSLARAERHTDAAAAFGEGLAVIAPFVEGHVEAFAGLASALRQEYIAACEKAGVAPDAALLKRVTRALGGSANAD
jgi:hypothetical protein